MPPDAVVFAESTDEVVAAVKSVREDMACPIVPFGAGTSVEGNALAVQGGVSLDLSRMTRIVAVNAGGFRLHGRGGRPPRAAQRAFARPGPVLPDRSRVPTQRLAAWRQPAHRAPMPCATARCAKRCSPSLSSPPTAASSAPAGGRASRPRATISRACLSGSEGTLGIITEVTLRLHAIPEAISAATCSFETIGGAVDTVVQSIQLGIPARSGRDPRRHADPRRQPLVEDGPARAYDPVLRVPRLASATSPSRSKRCANWPSANGGGEFRWAEKTEDRKALWKARHEAYYAAVNLRPGAIGWATDVCVPMSRLAECISETKTDLAGVDRARDDPWPCRRRQFPRRLLDRSRIRPTSLTEVKAINAKLVRRALADGRHVHRRARHRPRQAGVAGRGAWAMRST